MEYSQDYLEIKKQLFDLIQMSNKTIETKTNKINQELASLQKGNHLINLKIKDIIEKLDGFSFRTNTTLVTEVSSQLNGNNTINQKHQRTTSSLNKSENGKINIQNLVINKKVQIGKHFSKLNISNISTSPNKPINYPVDHHHFHPPVRNNSNFIQKKHASIIKMKIFSKNKAKESNLHSDIPLIEKRKSNSDNPSHDTLNQEDKEKPNNNIPFPNMKIDITLKTSKSINDVRKFSIMDIPAFEMKDISVKKKKKTEKSMRHYLYTKKQNLFYLLAKQK